MKILFLCNEYPHKNFAPGGIGRSLQTIAEDLSYRGHNVFVAGYYKQNKIKSENINGVEFISFPMKFKFFNTITLDFFIRKRFKKFLNRFVLEKNIEIVEGNDWELTLALINVSVAKVLRFHSSTVILNIFDNSYNFFDKRLLKKSINKSDSLIFVSDWLMKNYNELKYNYDKNKVVITNPVNDKYFRIEKIKPAKKIVFVGTLNYSKGIYELINSWSDISEKYPEYSMHLYGKPGDAIDYIEDYMSDLSLRIFYHGAVSIDELCGVYSSASLAVFPSHYEGDGLAVKEAGVAGVPLLLSDIIPFKTTFNSIGSVRFFSVKNEKNFKDELEYMLENNSELLRLSLKTRTLLMKKYSIKRINDVNLKLYLEILKTRLDNNYEK